MDVGSGRIIKCVAEEDSLVVSPSWYRRNAIVTGISSCELDGPNLVSVIRLKKGETPIIY
jgi:hypothetical protein